MRLFKVILSGALNAYSDKFLAQEIEFLINAFAGNEYNNTVLEKVTKEYMEKLFLYKKRKYIYTIKNDEIVKLPCEPKLRSKLENNI